MQKINPQDQTFWYIDKTLLPPLRHSITADVAIIGGGMAGLTAAQSFVNAGRDVTLIEKTFCGAGASGKSSGFITPDSEFSLHDLQKLYGLEQAKRLWEFATDGVQLIKKNIDTYALACDYQEQDTCVVASSSSAFTKTIEREYKARHESGYPSMLYTAQQLPQIINSVGYYGGIRYGGSFGIQPYKYCQALKNVLSTQGVTIFEETPALSLDATTITTPYGQIKAQTVIVCMDYFVTELKRLVYEIYHAQTFLLLSAPLTDAQIRAIFPDGNLMVWDTDLIYNYYSISADNRLMVGGSSLLYTYARHEKHMSRYLINKLTAYFNNKFPDAAIRFVYCWPGLIGITKDIMPIAGRDKDNKNVYYISGAAGLPWAAALGNYSASHITNGNNTFDDLFSPYRNVTLGPISQTLLGTKLTFALSNFARLQSI